MTVWNTARCFRRPDGKPIRFGTIGRNRCALWRIAECAEGAEREIGDGGKEFGTYGIIDTGSVGGETHHG